MPFHFTEMQKIIVLPFAQHSPHRYSRFKKLILETAIHLPLDVELQQCSHLALTQRANQLGKAFPMIFPNHGLSVGKVMHIAVKDNVRDRKLIADLSNLRLVGDKDRKIKSVHSRTSNLGHVHKTVLVLLDENWHKIPSLSAKPFCQLYGELLPEIGSGRIYGNERYATVPCAQCNSRRHGADSLLQ